jgi:hypothetical protein
VSGRFVVFGWFCGAYLTISKGLMQVVFGLTLSLASQLLQDRGMFGIV